MRRISLQKNQELEKGSFSHAAISETPHEASCPPQPLDTGISRNNPSVKAQQSLTGSVTTSCLQTQPGLAQHGHVLECFQNFLRRGNVLVSFWKQNKIIIIKKIPSTRNRLMSAQEERRYGEVPGTQKTPGNGSSATAPLPPSVVVGLQGGPRSVLDETRRARCQTPRLGRALSHQVVCPSPLTWPYL